MLSTSTRTLRRTALLLIAPLALLVAACGADDETASEAPAATPSSAPSDSTAPDDDADADDGDDDESADGTGTGTITVAGASYPFTADECEIEEDDDGLEVEAEGAGEANGQTYGVTVTSSTNDRGLTRESVRLVFTPQMLSTVTNIYTTSSGQPVFAVTGDTLMVEGEFLSAGGGPAGPGTVELTCG